MPTLTYYPPNYGTAITFSEDDSAPYKLLLKYDGFSETPVSHKTVSAPGQHGADNINSLATARSVTFDIAIQASTVATQKTLVTALAGALNPLGGAGRLEYANDDGNTYILYCKGNPGLTLWQSDAGKTQTIQIATVNLIAYDPFWYSGAPHQLALSISGTDFFPLEFPFTFPNSSPTDTATNAGSFETPVTITLNGPITNPALTRTALEDGVSTTRTFSMTIVIDTDEKVVITTGKGNQTCTYTDDGGTENLGEPYVDLDSEYWVLEPGDNVIALTCDSSGDHADLCLIEWSDKYVGV